MSAAVLVSQRADAWRVLRTVGRWVRRNPITAAGFAIILALIFIALLAPLVAPYGADELDPSNVLAAPSSSHLFGTGNFGEDIFSRVLYGARYDLLIGFGAVAIGLVIGCAIGAFAGFVGGAVDEIWMRIMDMLSAFPGFILAMGIAGALGPSLRNLIVAISLVNVPIYARLMRGSFLVVKRSQYATAAVGVGAPPLRILRWHLLPNTWTPIFVQATLQFGYAILDAAGLSFIGLGVRLPTPEWGVMVSLGIERIVSGEWWVSFFPGLAIAVAVMGFNLVGDGLRDLIDPRRR
ncbi:MAG TPA: ABC transporter permease [Gaiellaceae bacterium]|jgi:peptide/nickel transport system permease protein